MSETTQAPAIDQEADLIAGWETQYRLTGSMPRKLIAAYVERAYPMPDPADVYHLICRYRNLAPALADAAEEWVAERTNAERRAHAAARRDYKDAPTVTNWVARLTTERLYSQACYAARLRYLEENHR